MGWPRVNGRSARSTRLEDSPSFGSVANRLAFEIAIPIF